MRKKVVVSVLFLALFCGLSCLYKQHLLRTYGSLLREASFTEDELDLSANELRVLYWSTIAAHNPSLALPGTNIARLRASIDELSRSLQELKNVATDANVDTLNSLYPLNFLNSLERLELTRRELIAEPTSAHVRAYRKAVRNAIRAYEVDLDHFIRDFKTAVPENDMEFLVTEGVVTRERTLDALRLLRARAPEMRARLRDQELCSWGLTPVCNLAWIGFPSLESTSSRENIKPLSSEVIENTRTLLQSMVIPGHYVDTTVIGLNESACVSDPQRRFFSITYSDSSTSTSHYTNASVIADARLVRLSEQKSTPLLTYYHDVLNINFIPASETNHYQCLSYAKDLGRVYAANNARLLALENPLSAHTINNTVMTRLRDFEHTLSGQTVHERDIHDYLQFASLQKESFDADTRLLIADLILQFSYASSGFETALMKITQVSDEHVRHHALGLPTTTILEPRFLFQVRSGYTALFLGSNISAGHYTPPSPEPTEKYEQPFELLSSVLNERSFSDLLEETVRARMIQRGM